ncbi:MAG: class I SAM-dependent methyltransferase [Planctomycetota bacterium]
MNRTLLAAAGPVVQVDPRSSPALRWNVRRQDGVVIVRHQAAAEPQPAEDWADRLAAFLDLGGETGVKVAGAKRLDPAGHVAAMGEFVVHPKGFHHHGRGVPATAYRFPEEVDTIAAGVAVVDETVFNHVGGDELLGWGPLGMLALGLAVREAGHRVLAVPQVVVTDGYTPEHDDEAAAQFRGRFGFDWFCADLDEVRERHRRTGLTWNARHFADAMPFEKYEQRGALVWESFEKADYFRKRAHHLASAAKQCVDSTETGGGLLDVGCGDGFFCHLFAQLGLDVTGLDPEPEGVAQSQRMTEAQAYPGPRPRFEVGTGTAIPFDDDTFAAVTLFDVIEHLTNPIAVLREIARVLRPGGKAMIVTPGWQFGGSSDAVYHGFEYTMEELVRQSGATPGMTVVHTGQITGVYRDLIVVAQKG